MKDPMRMRANFVLFFLLSLFKIHGATITLKGEVNLIVQFRSCERCRVDYSPSFSIESKEMRGGVCCQKQNARQKKNKK